MIYSTAPARPAGPGPPAATMADSATESRASGFGRHRWVALAVLTAARTVMGLQFQSVGAVAPLLTERLHIHGAELGILIGLFSLPGIVLALPGGLLGARFGDRRVVLVGFALMVGGSALIGAAEGFALAAVGRLLSATGAVLLNVLLTKIVADWFSGREIVWAMALLINAWPVGIGVALFVLPPVAAGYGVAASFHLAAAAALAGLAAIALLYRDPAGPARGDSIGLSVLSRRETVGVALAALPWTLYNVAYAVMLGFVPGFLVGAGLGVADAGLLLGLNTLLVIVSVQAGGALAQWVARPDVVVALGLVAGALALLALPQAPILPTLVLMGLLGGLPAASLVAAPVSVLRAESRSAGMGLFYTAYYTGMTLLPPVAGWLQDAAGQPTTALYFSAVAFVVTLPCWAGFRAFARRT
jgi:predicted MFS family arabinose efflux permease